MNEQTSDRVKQALHIAAEDVPNDLDLWSDIYRRLPNTAQHGLDGDDNRGLLDSYSVDNGYGSGASQRKAKRASTGLRRNPVGGISMAAALVVGFVGLALLIVSNYDHPQSIVGPLFAATVTPVPPNAAPVKQTSPSTTLAVDATQVAWSPDSKTLAFVVGSSHEPLRFWKPGDTAKPRTIPFIGNIFAIAWSPNSQLLAVASANLPQQDQYSVQIFWADGTPMRVLTGLTSDVNGLAWSPDSSKIIAASIDKNLTLWNVDGTLLKQTEDHSRIAFSLAWSPDGKTLALGNTESVDLWDIDNVWLPNANPRQSLHPDLESPSNDANSMAWSPDGQTLAVGYQDSSVRLWQSNGLLRLVLNGHSDSVLSLTWSPDGTYLATGSRDGSLRLWRTEGTSFRVTGSPSSPGIEAIGEPANERLAVLTAFGEAVQSVDWSHHGDMLASVSADGLLRLWNVDTATLVSLSPHTKEISVLAWSPNGNTLVTGTDDGTLSWSRPYEGPFRSFAAHTDRVVAVVWSPDSLTFVSVSWDKTARLWSSTGQLLRVLPGILEDPTAAAWSPDGKTIAIGTANGPTLWSAAGDPMTPPNWDRAGKVVSLGWSPDGHIFAMSFEQGVVSLWKADAIQTATTDTSAEIAALHSDYDGFPAHIVWSADSKEIAIGFVGRLEVWKSDGTPLITLDAGTALPVRPLAWCAGGALAYAINDKLWLWQYKDGDSLDHTLHGPFTGSGSTLTALAWSSTGLLASGGHNGTAQVWDDKGKVLLTFPNAGSGPVTSMAWSPDGAELMLGYSDGSLRAWQVRNWLQNALQDDSPLPTQT